MVKKVLITGGNGYIGSRLCLYLADVGYAVTPVCYPEVPADTFPVRCLTALVATMPVPASPSGGQTGIPAFK